MSVLRAAAVSPAACAAPARRAEMAKQDYYATLGVAREAGADDLKKAYRKLAMQFHPDRNPGDKQAEARFKELNEAYDVLKDEQKRAAYDRYGHAAFEQGGGAGGFTGGFDFSAGGGLGDIFDQMFGDFTRPSRRRCASPRRQRYPPGGRDRPRRGVHRRQGEPARADARGVRCVRRFRIGRQDARGGYLHDLPGCREGSRPAGLLPGRAHLPDLRRPRPGDPQSLQGLPRRRHGAARADLAGGDPAGRGGRHADQARRRGRGGRTGCAARRSVRSRRDPAACNVPA